MYGVRITRQGVSAELPVVSCWNKSYISQNMAAQHTRSFGREAAAVYLAAALVVFGTWAASRYLILRKFENIEQNEVSRSIEVMRKALVTKNTEIETVIARLRALGRHVLVRVDARPEFRVPELLRGRPRRNERRPGLAARSRRKSCSRLSRTTPTMRAIATRRARRSIAEINRLTPIVRTVLDQEGTLRLVQINGVPHVIAAHTVLRSDRSGPAGGTLVFARRIGAPEIASIGADTQLNVHFAMLDDRAVAAEKAGTAGRARRPPHRAPFGQRHRGPAAPRHHRQSSARGDVHHAAALRHAERPAGRALPGRLGRVARQHRGRRLARLQRPAAPHFRRPRPPAKPAIAPSSIAPPPASCCSTRLRAACWTPIRRRSA